MNSQIDYRSVVLGLFDEEYAHRRAERRVRVLRSVLTTSFLCVAACVLAFAALGMPVGIGLFCWATASGIGLGALVRMLTSALDNPLVSMDLVAGQAQMLVHLEDMRDSLRNGRSFWTVEMATQFGARPVVTPCSGVTSAGFWQRSLNYARVLERLSPRQRARLVKNKARANAAVLEQGKSLAEANNAQLVFWAEELRRMPA